MTDAAKLAERVAVLQALADHVEREEPSITLWVVAYQTLYPDDDIQDAGRFGMLVVAGAWRDAAAMLMPEKAAIDLIVFGDDCVIVTLAAGLHFVAHSEVPNGPHAEACARAAAALRAHAAGAGE